MFTFTFLTILCLSIRSTSAVASAVNVNAFADNFRTGIYNVDTSGKFDSNISSPQSSLARYTYTTGYPKAFNTVPIKVVLGIKNYYQLMPTKTIDVYLMPD